MSGRSSDERKRLLLFVLLGVAVVALPGRLAWSMRSSAVSEADDVREQARLVRERVTLARRDAGRVDDLTRQLEVLRGAMPAESDLPSVLDALAGLATASGVVWQGSTQTPPAMRDAARTTGSDPATTVRPAGTEAESSSTPAGTAAAGSSATTVATGDGGPLPVTGSFTIDVDVAGTTEALTSYLDQLRSLPRLLTVERLSFTWNSGTDARLPVTAHLTLKAYTWAGAPRPDPSTTVPSTASS